MSSSEVVDGVHVLHLGDGPNLVDTTFLAALEGALDAVEADEDVVGLVTVGEGKAYSQGYDLGMFASVERAELEALIDWSLHLLARVLVFRVPTVAALNGHAFGYGAMLGLAHDLRVQRHDRGWLCLPEVDLGLQFRPMQLALIKAKLTPDAAAESILGGRRWDGPAAQAADVVTAVASEDELIAAAVALAQGRAGKGRPILEALKRDVYADVLALCPT
jgi:enoyl-CoA hydratase/carnithine racemase